MNASDNEVAATVVNALTSEGQVASHANEAMERFFNDARWIPRAISPFINLDTAINAALADPEDLPENYERDIAVYRKLLHIDSAFSELLSAFQAKNEQGVSALLSHIMREARLQDTHNVKTSILSYLPADPENDPIRPNIVGGEKYKRGWNHPWTARVLCPLKYVEDFKADSSDFMKRVQEGKIKIRAKDFPSFLYPHDSTFDETQPDLNLFRGHVLVHTLCLIYTRESSIFSGYRAAPKASQAELHEMHEVTAEAIAYAACQAYINLSSLTQWSNFDGYFDLEKFHGIIISLFEDSDDQWVKETLKFLTKKLPSLQRKAHRANAPLADDSEADDDDNDPTGILALRERRAEEARRAADSERTHTEQPYDPREDLPPLRNTPSANPRTPSPPPLPSAQPPPSSQHRQALGMPRINELDTPVLPSSADRDMVVEGSRDKENDPPPGTRQIVSGKRRSGVASGKGRGGTDSSRPSRKCHKLIP